MIERIKKLYRENKMLFYGIGLFLFLVLIFILDRLRLTDPDALVQSPIITTTENRDPDKLVSFVRAIPSDGNTNQFDTFQVIRFVFTRPVDPESARMSILPYQPVDVIAAHDDPNAIDIIPQQRGWSDFVEYTIKLNTISGLNNEVLDSPVTYKYRNTPPPPERNVAPY